MLANQRASLKQRLENLFKRARKITDESQVYLPLMKKALYLLLCINSTNDRTVPLHRSQSGSHSNLASRRESETSTISQSNSNTSLSSRLGRVSNSF